MNTGLYLKLVEREGGDRNSYSANFMSGFRPIGTESDWCQFLFLTTVLFIDCSFICDFAM